MRKTLALSLGVIAVLILAACTLPATATPTPTQEDDVVIAIGTPLSLIGSLQADVTFQGTVDCGFWDWAWIKVENTSDLVYKHIMVDVREGAQPAPNWADPWPPDTFYTSGMVCSEPSAVHFQKPNKLKPTQTGHAYDFFQREDDVPFYTLYYIICTWHELSGECTEGEFDFVNFQPLDFFAIEMVPCWLDPGPLKTEVDSLGEGMTARIMYRDESAMYGYFRLSNESMCWMDLDMLMFDPPEGSENIIFDVLSVPVYDMDENGNGQVNGNGHAPMFDTNMFYYGSCDPQQVMVEYMADYEDIFNVVMFYRIQDVETETKTEWTAVSMNAIGNDYYGRSLTSAEIPDHTMYANSYVQLQFVVTNAEGEQISRSEVFEHMLMLSQCGRAPAPGGGATETPLPIPTPAETRIPPPN